MSFLRLPLELRWRIYELALQDCIELTIATSQGESEESNEVPVVPGLPRDQQPVICNGLEKGLLSFTSFAPQKWKPSARPIPAEDPDNRNKPMSQPSAQLTASVAAMQTTQSYFALHPTTQDATATRQLSPYALMATCDQIRCELRGFLARRSMPPLRLHVSYPYGVLVLRHIYPALLNCTSSIHIGGFHTGEWDVDVVDSSSTVPNYRGPGSPQMSTLPPVHSGYDENNASRRGPNAPSISHESHLASTAALEHITEKLYPPPSRSTNSKLESLSMGIFTPKQAGYHASLSANAPCALALQSVASGSLDSWCWNGTGGTAWAVRVRGLAKGMPEGRFITNSWPTWPEGQEDWAGVVTGTRGPEPIVDWGITVLD